MSNERKLIEEQNTLWNRMQEIQREAEASEWSAEQRTNWDAAEKRLTEVSEDIERVRRGAQLASVDRSQVLDTSAPVEVTSEERGKNYDAAFDAYMRRGLGRLNAAQQELLERNFTEVRAQGVATDAAGGYLVPEGFRTVMTEALRQYGGLMGLANEISTTSGNDLPWPTNDDTGNKGAILAENTQIGEQDVTLGTNRLLAHMYTSKLVRVSFQLLQDSAFNLESWLPVKLGERIGRAAAEHWCTGTGTAQPLGLVTGGTVGYTGAVSATAAITYDDLLEIEHSVDPAYRPGGQFVMSDGMLKLIRKLKDNDLRPLWVPIPAPGFTPTINGISYTIDQDMPAPAPAAKSLVFGNIRAGYIIRHVRDIQMVRLQERYADFLQVGFFGYARMDGRPDDTKAYRVFQHGAAA